MYPSSHLRVFGASLPLAILAATVLAQAPEKTDAARTGRQPPWRRLLRDDDARRVEAMEKAIGDLEKQGRFAEAATTARDVLAIRRRAQGDDHWQTANARIKEQACSRVAGLARQAQSDLATALRLQVEAEGIAREGHHAQAEPLLRKVLAARRTILGEEHPDTAESHSHVAAGLNGQAKYDEADPHFREALAIYRRALGEDHPDTATGYNNLAANLDDQGRHAEAEPLYRRALALRREILGEDDPDTALGYNNLAHNLNSRGRSAEAEPFARKALTIYLRRLGRAHPDTSMGYNNLAFSLDLQGRYAEAEPLHRAALAIRREVLGEDDSDTADSYDNLAYNLRGQGKHAQGEPLHRAALAIRRKVLGEDHPDTAKSCNNLASNLESQGKSAEVEPLLREALAIDHRVLGEGHPLTGAGYHNLASCLGARGKYADAERLCRKALAITVPTLGEDHPYTAAIYHNLATSLAALGKYADAEAMAQAADRSHAAARLRISYSGLARAEFGSNRPPSTLLAALLARRGQDLDAWRHWESGLARGLSDDLAARHGRPLTPDERRRQEDLIGQLNRLDNQIGALAGAGTSTDAQRGRLADLRGRRLELQGHLAQMEADLVRKYQVAAGAVYSLDRIRARLPDDTALVGWLDLRTMPHAADPRGDHWACIVRRVGAPRWIRIGGTGPNLTWTDDDDHRPDQVRQLLGSEDRLAWQKPLAALAEQRLAPLEPVLTARDGLPAVRHLIVVPSPALAGIPVEAMLEAGQAQAPRPLVSYAPSGTLFAWLRERRGEDPDGPARPRRLLALGDPVPPPADDPDSPTARPPDQGLLVRQVSPGSSAELAGIRPGDVLLRYAGARLSTRDDLQNHLRAGGPGGASVVVSVWRGGQTFDRTLRTGPPGIVLDDRPAAEAVLARRADDALLRRTRGAAFARLPGSGREVRGIAGLFDQSQIHLGSDASEQTLEALRARNELANFAVIHLATHGEANDLAPMNSRLLLSQDHLPDPTAEPALDGPAYDGILTAGEVLSSWKLQAELVTLSTCRSGLGRQSGGEGHVGFAQAFFLAGTRSLLVSLWEVDDRATALLMTRFYRNWLGKRPELGRPLSKGEALNEAKTWLRSLTGGDVDRELDSIARGELRSRSSRPAADHPFAHPHDWAGFILMGDPD